MTLEEAMVLIEQMQQRDTYSIEKMDDVRSNLVDLRNIVEWCIMDVDTAKAELAKPLEERDNK